MINQQQVEDAISEKLIVEISELVRKTKILELTIKDRVAGVMQDVADDPAYYLKGKPAPVSYIEKSWAITGLKGELIPLRTELATLESELENKRLRWEYGKILLSLFQTQSANERGV